MKFLRREIGVLQVPFNTFEWQGIPGHEPSTIWMVKAFTGHEHSIIERQGVPGDKPSTVEWWTFQGLSPQQGMSMKLTLIVSICIQLNNNNDNY